MLFKGPITSAILTAAIASIPVLIKLFAVFMRLYDLFFRGFSILESPLENYDFIIVGGGSAGSAIASRLSEDDSVSVLLIEAGGNPNPMTYIPATAPYLGHPAIDWQYMTVPLNGSALGSQNQQMPWPRGKAIGGTSNLNFMIYNRGNKRDFDRWAEMSDDLRWSFDNIVKYFLRIEDYYGAWDAESGGYHSIGGPLRIEQLQYSPGVEEYIFQAAAEKGFPTRDANTVQTPGFTPLDYTQKRGTRFSTYRAYIQPVEKRPNLHIFRYAQVTKILFADDDELRAVGVTYVRHGIPSFAWASKEVIVSCGTVASPQLLMLSGIGPTEHLLNHGIHPRVDLPVGQNLQDHVVTFVGPFLIDKPKSFMAARDLTVKSILQYIRKGSGPLSVPLGVTTFGMAATSTTLPDWPNIIWPIHTIGMQRTLQSALNTLFNVEDLFDRFLEPHIGQDGFFVMQSLALPKSTGYILLRDANPFSPPIINPQYYSNREDVFTMLEGIQYLLQIVENTTSLAALGARLSPEHVPGCEGFQHRSPSYWECVMRTLTSSHYHPAGTCRMGMIDDPTTVLDSSLRVKGIEGLRVADASVMPKVTNANLNAPAIVIGEMCADMIKETWGLL